MAKQAAKPIEPTYLHQATANTNAPPTGQHNESMEGRIVEILSTDRTAFRMELTEKCLVSTYKAN